MPSLLYISEKNRPGSLFTKRLLLIVWVAAFVFFSAASAYGISISASVDKTQTTIHDPIELVVSVEGTREAPALPRLPDFRIHSRGSSSKVSIINGQVSSSVEYRYSLLPKKTGTFTIGPFTVSHNGNTVKSNKIQLTVTGKAAAAAGKHRQTDDIFVTAEVDNKTPFCSEQIIYTFRFFRKVRVADARLVESPSFEGFLTRKTGKEKEYKKSINGHTYAVTELRHALFPLSPGVIEIDPSVLQCEVVVQNRRRRGFFNDPFFNDPFFGFSETKTKTFSTAPITVMVKPLPQKGMPAHFDNLVGDFTLDARLSTRAPKAGESVTLTLTLSGTGNLKSTTQLSLPELQMVKAYDDKPAFEPFVSGGRAGGKLVIKKALVPLAPGELHIPRLTVPYFDPDAEAYKTANSGPFVLKVQPSEEEESLASVDADNQAQEKQAVKIIGEDILPIHVSPQAQIPAHLNPLTAGIIGLFLAPLAVFLVFFSIKLKKSNRLSSESAQRARNARKAFTKKLPDIKKALNTDDAEFYQLSAKALKEFLGDKLNLPGTALTAREIAELEQKHFIEKSTADDLKKLFEFFDAGQYGFRTFSREQRQEMLQNIITLTKYLNKKL